MSTRVDNGQVETDLAAFLHERTSEQWPSDRELFTDGGLSSLFAMELVVHLENTFGVTVSGPDLQLANFRTITAMSALVRRLREPSDE